MWIMQAFIFCEFGLKCLLISENAFYVYDMSLTDNLT